MIELRTKKSLRPGKATLDPLGVMEPLGSESKPELYTYQPLDDGQNQIRLLYLLPGGTSAPIHIKVKTIQFSSNCSPEYEALSYAWGSSENPTSVWVNGIPNKSIPVTQNLEEALQHLRWKKKPRTLWIDALCIDQRNIEERAQQVAIMGRIYAKANGVIAWIGPESGNSTIAFDCLATINDNVELNDDLAMTSRTRDGTWASAEAALPYTEDQMLALSDLLHRLYFDRLWVWQEIRLGYDHATLLCGYRTLPWYQFGIAMRVLHLKSHPPTSVVTGLDERLEQLVVVCIRYSTRSLLDAMNVARAFQCSDPRDKIYSVTNMARTADLSIMPAYDYSKAVEEAYIDFTRKYISTKRDLQILLYAARRDTGLSLSSWVTDWTVPNFNFITGSYCADARVKMVLDNIDDNAISVKGKSVTRIRACEHFHPQPMQTYATSITNAMSVIKDFARRALSRAVVTEQQLEDVSELSRVLFANQFSERCSPAPNILRCQAQQCEKLLMMALGHDVHDALCTDTLVKLLKYLLRRVPPTTIFVTEEGKLGLGPLGMQVGDTINILFGCKTSMVLRKDLNESYKVIGPVYYDGIMDGEAILGSLPEHFESVEVVHPQLVERGLELCFRDRRNGEIQTEDPRLGPIPDGWQKQDSWSQGIRFSYIWDGSKLHHPVEDPRLDLDALEAGGLQVDTFNIV